MFLTILLSVLLSFAPLQIESNQVCNAQNEIVETKQKKNILSEFGYALFNLDDLCRGEFINAIIDVYPSASIIYSPLFVGFSFDIQGDIFIETNYVDRRYVNNTDLGYSNGRSCHTFTYTCNTIATSLGNNVEYTNWTITNNYNSNYAHFNLFTKRTSTYIYYGYAWEIKDTNIDGYYVTPLSSSSNNFIKVLSSRSNNDFYNGYSNGYNDGYDAGLDVGENNPNQLTRETIFNQGYYNGYNAGLSEAQDQDTLALQIFSGCVEVGLLPINVMLRMFEYEIFGINIAGFVSALLTIAIVIIVIRVVTGKKDD